MFQTSDKLEVEHRDYQDALCGLLHPDLSDADHQALMDELKQAQDEEDAHLKAAHCDQVKTGMTDLKIAMLSAAKVHQDFFDDVKKRVKKQGKQLIEAQDVDTESRIQEKRAHAYKEMYEASAAQIDGLAAKETRQAEERLALAQRVAQSPAHPMHSFDRFGRPILSCPPSRAVHLVQNYGQFQSPRAPPRGMQPANLAILPALRGPHLFRSCC